MTTPRSDQREFDIEILLTVRVTATAEGYRAIERYVENEDGIQEYLYGPMDRNQVLSHLAYNGSANGINDASRLDGFADLDRGALTMSVTDADSDPYSVREVTRG